jgi:hypothetical protein
MQSIAEAAGCLQKYAAIICFSYFAFADKSLLGDYLAEYVENGKDSIFFDTLVIGNKEEEELSLCHMPTAIQGIFWKGSGRQTDMTFLKLVFD